MEILRAQGRVSQVVQADLPIVRDKEFMKTIEQLEAISRYKDKCFFEDKARLVERANRVLGQRIRRAREEITTQNEIHILEFYENQTGGCYVSNE